MSGLPPVPAQVGGLNVVAYKGSVIDALGQRTSFSYAVLVWLPNAFTDDVTSYRVYIDGVAVVSMPPTTSPCCFYGPLDGGQPHVFAVSGVNPNGEGPQSIPMSAMVP
jgi:hypothetical protein